MRAASRVWLVPWLTFSLALAAHAAGPTESERAELRKELQALRQTIGRLESRTRLERTDVPDVAVYAKAVEWILRHDEFYKPEYVQQARTALDTGRHRAEAIAGGRRPWTAQLGTTVRGYRSRIDGSIQPYALSLPQGFDPEDSRRWPLHVKLHGRAGQMNEVNFIHRFDNSPAPLDQTWVQLDVFGRTNNAYRWAGETDVFEALADVRRRLRIDGSRMTLHGFSMGGAGAWHLGLHYPSLWSSVGPGAGFVDFYKYQKQNEQLPPYQHATLGIYDAVDYALNASNVPVCTYGGELDAQLLASTTMVDLAAKQDVAIKLLIGPGMGHKFHPDSFREFMAFHLEKARIGRPSFPGRRQLRFATRTVKYNRCEWLTIEEIVEQYAPTRVETVSDADGRLKIETHNVAVLQIARDIADTVTIDGTTLPLGQAADNLLPGVYFEQTADGWVGWDYEESKAYEDFAPRFGLRKRHNLQGPIDDAFMESFVCVRGTGTPLSAAHQKWVDWTLDRFRREFDKWMRGEVRVVDDSALTEDMIRQHHVILFGDPQSNRVLGRIVSQLPISWDGPTFRIQDQTYSADQHGAVMIYPNPLNPRRYVVLNSGHTFHAADFQASNAWLFPRLGDVAVLKFAKDGEDNYLETVQRADIFDGSWSLRVAEPERDSAD